MATKRKPRDYPELLKGFQPLGDYVQSINTLYDELDKESLGAETTYRLLCKIQELDEVFLFLVDNPPIGRELLGVQH